MTKSSQNQSRQHLHRSELDRLEEWARSQGFSHIAGIDEAGRGPLAGPVVAACCLFKKRGLYFPGINDSKLLSSKKREQLFFDLTNHEDVLYGVGIVSHEVIDEINILQATHQAMHEAVANLELTPDYLLVDGLQLRHKIASQKVIRGDRQSQVIMAAAIIAKETRDRLMKKYHDKYPEYGFDQHKGYGTAKHREAIRQHGSCPIHRKTFSTGIK